MSDCAHPGTPFTGEQSLEQMRLWLRDFATERDWHQFHLPRNLLLALTGEVGELAECFQWKGDDGCAPGLHAWSDKEKGHLGEEISDVLFYLIRLSDVCGVDLTAACRAKLDKNAAKYPAHLVKGSSRKYTEYAADVDHAAAQPAKRARTTLEEG